MEKQILRIESITLEWAQRLCARLAEIGFDVEYGERWDNIHRIATVRATREVKANV